jgi:hypothetical protein
MTSSAAAASVPCVAHFLPRPGPASLATGRHTEHSSHIFKTSGDFSSPEAGYYVTVLLLNSLYPEFDLIFVHYAICILPQSA